MRMPYANLEIINFYTLDRRHVEFWAWVKGSKGIVVENIGLFDWLTFNICRINPRATKSVSTHKGAFSSSLNLPLELAPKYLIA